MLEIDPFTSVHDVHNLGDMLASHAEWKVKLRTAVHHGEHLDAETIRKNDQCPMGKWLAAHPGDQRLHELRSAHAQFHLEAGIVAEVCNTKDAIKAEKMLGAGTPFSRATAAVRSAVTRLGG